MPWGVNVLSDLPFVDARYSGVITDAELSTAVTVSLSLARTLGIGLFLTDCTRLEGGHSVFDLHGLASDIGSYGWLCPLKEAVVIAADGENAELTRFWEAICRNRDFRVRVFRDREVAVKWLLEMPEN
ncbi:MAG TPA: hypothetical protein VM165_15935 [Planctomycetaceae bacterium]|nr:hypothetical protein [Planctomycetaceae bacterium]